MKKNKYTPEEFAAAVGTSLERLEQLKAEKNTCAIKRIYS